MPKPLSDKYRFIMITTGESDGNFRTNSIVRYVDKNKTHFILGVSIATQDEVVSFKFKDDNTFEILSYTPTGESQINVLEIYQFN